MGNARAFHEKRKICSAPVSLVRRCRTTERTSDCCKIAITLIDQNSRCNGATWVRKLHLSNVPSIGAPNQCLCRSEASVFERVF